MRVDEEIDRMEVRLRERREQGKGVRIRGRKERGKENQDMCIFLGDRKLFPGGSNEHTAVMAVVTAEVLLSLPTPPTLPTPPLQRFPSHVFNAPFPSSLMLCFPPLQHFPPLPSNTSRLSSPTLPSHLQRFPSHASNVSLPSPPTAPTPLPPHPLPNFASRPPTTTDALWDSGDNAVQCRHGSNELICYTP